MFQGFAAKTKFDIHMYKEKHLSLSFHRCRLFVEHWVKIIN